jgi:hypothetical protein
MRACLQSSPSSIPSIEELTRHFSALSVGNSTPSQGIPSAAPQPSPAGPALTRPILRAITRNARLLGYDRLSAERSVHHLVWLLAGNPQPPINCLMPTGTLQRVLVIRSAPMLLLERLIGEIHQHNPGCAITVLCHRGDVETVARIPGQAAQPPLIYPRFEPYNPATLAQLLSTLAPDWDAIFTLDNNPGGRGSALSHIWAAFEDNSTSPRYTFNSSGALYVDPPLQDDNRPETRLARELLEWLRRQEPQR